MELELEFDFGRPPEVPGTPGGLEGILARAEKAMAELARHPPGLAGPRDSLEDEGAAALASAWSTQAAACEIASNVPERFRKAACSWLVRRITLRLLGAFVLEYSLNARTYGQSKRCTDALFWYHRRVRDHKGQLCLQDMFALKSISESIGSDLDRHALVEVESFLRHLDVPLGPAARIGLNDDERVNSLIVALDASSRATLRFRRYYNLGESPIRFVFGLYEKAERYTLVDEYAHSASVPIGMVSSSACLKGAYEKEVLIRDFSVKSIIRNSYSWPRFDIDFSDNLVRVIHSMIPSSGGEEAYLGAISAILIRGIWTYRARRLSTRVVVSEVLGVEELILVCEKDGVPADEILVSILCSLRDGHHASVGERYSYLFKTMLTGTLLFDIDLSRPASEAVDAVRAALASLVDFGDASYARVHERLLLFLNDTLHRLAGSVRVELPLYRDVRNRLASADTETREAGAEGFPATPSHNLYHEVLEELGRSDAAGLATLRDLTVSSYVERADSLVGAFWPSPCRVRDEEDFDGILDLLTARTAEMASVRGWRPRARRARGS
jgi:hypothetical protein